MSFLGWYFDDTEKKEVIVWGFPNHPDTIPYKNIFKYDEDIVTAMKSKVIENGEQNSLPEEGEELSEQEYQDILANTQEGSRLFLHPVKPPPRQ